MMLILVIINLLDYDRGARRAFNAPNDVAWAVRIAQYAAIFIAVWTQDDIIEAFDVFVHSDRQK
eukprot:2470416-Ditylum_brightwellii.AAC.1